MPNRFLELLDRARSDDRPVLVDGAMGTQLMAAGLEFGDPPELWNVLPGRREQVRAVHRAYLDAGSDVILTNTFGGSPFRLKLHNLQDRVFELNEAGAKLARAEAGERVVAGNIGPSGELFEPAGALVEADAVEGFARQAEGLAAGGADVFWIETMSDLKEVRAAIAGARLAAPSLPVVATLSFDTRGFTMMGVSPADAINELLALDVAALGGNCGNGPDELEAVVDAMHRLRPDVALVGKSNAGMPAIVDGKACYQCAPDAMADSARRIRAFGATIIGGCCGSTPAHVAAIRRALFEMPPLDPSTLSLTVSFASRAERSPARESARSRRASRRAS